MQLRLLPMISSAALLNSRTSLTIRPSKVRPSRGGFFLAGGKRGKKSRGKRASPSCFPECDKVYASQGYIPFGQIVYTLQQKGIYLSSKRYIPHDSEVYSSRRRGIVLQKKRYIPSEQRVYTFQMEVILLSAKCYITFGQKLYYFLAEVILLSVRSYITF